MKLNHALIILIQEQLIIYIKNSARSEHLEKKKDKMALEFDFGQAIKVPKFRCPMKSRLHSLYLSLTRWEWREKYKSKHGRIAHALN